MVIAGKSHVEKKLQKSCHMQSTCNAHDETCNHMVITGGNHVDAKYKLLVTWVITGGSHVEEITNFLSHE